MLQRIPLVTRLRIADRFAEHLQARVGQLTPAFVAHLEAHIVALRRP